MRKPLLVILNGFTILAMVFAASQLADTKVKADDAPTCCWYSDGCPGTETCWVPLKNQSQCCNPDDIWHCGGPNYCGQNGPPSGN
jgi:hypothetical protein